MITINDIKKILPFRISSDLGRAPIKEMSENVDNDIIDFDVFLPTIGKNLQRPFCWTLEQKQALIISIFKDVYIPSICAIQHKSTGKPTKFEIIDGKQRLSTMLAYYNNVFAFEINNELYYFKTLSKDLQNLYDNYEPKFKLAYSYEDEKISDEHKIAWFEMINFAGTPQDIEHLKSLKSS
jgi:uncharacterized protein with ParB-like and HNH nuclease domain